MWRSINSLSTLRICFYGISCVIMLATALRTLTIDMRGDDDPIIRLYWYIRWLLVTFWCNLFILLYAHVSIYCEWMERKGDDTHIRNLNKYRDLIMTSVIFPLAMYTGTVFWCFWFNDLSLLADIRIFEYLPNWAQYTLHMYCMVFVGVDLLLVPRRRPASLKFGHTVMSLFLLSFTIIVGVCMALGYPAYAFLNHMNKLEMVLVSIMNYCALLMFYMIQWLLIDYRWKNHFEEKKKLK